MSRPARFTKLKIAIGYILLLGVIFFSFQFIERVLSRMSQVDNSQLLQTDSLLSLIQAKDQHALNMLQTVTVLNDSMISVTEKEEMIAIRDSIIELQRVQHNVVQSRDSIVTTRPKRGFFKRVAEVFVPTTDTTVTVKSQVHQITDTLISELPAALPPQIIKRVTRKRDDTPLKAIRRSNSRLNEINSVLNAQIDSIINDYKEEVYQQARKEAEMHNRIRLNSTKTLTIIALGAIVLAAVFLIIIYFDMQRNHRYRRELEKANKRAAELLKARENILLTITHDFKAPLSSIIGYIDLVADAAHADQQQLYLDNMKSSSNHLLKLVNDLLDFHRLDLNKVQVNKVPFNAAELFNDIHVSFEPLTANKGLHLAYSIDPQLNACYSSDPLRIRQIVNNLLSNAVKFTTEGEIKLSAHYQQSKIIILISDTGKGMQPKDQEQIFQEFTRLPGAQGEEGFGLGLSIVKKLVHLLGGTIRVDSEMGTGSTFIVRLPLQPSDEEMKKKKKKQAPAADNKTKALKVLLIDDDRLQLDMITAMLKHNSIAAVGCQHIDELIECLRKDTYDVLLTDVLMPAMNGFDLLKLLRNSNIPQAQTIPVIAVTARSGLSREEYCHLGFSGCLNKPFSVEDLLNVLGVGCKDSQKEESHQTENFDLVALTRFSAEDDEAGKAILTSFIVETRKNAESMWQALTQKDVNGIANLAHKMIPLFTLVGAKEATDVLLILESKKDIAYTPETEALTRKAIELIYSVINLAERKGKAGKTKTTKE